MIGLAFALALAAGSSGPPVPRDAPANPEGTRNPTHPPPTRGEEPVTIPAKTARRRAKKAAMAAEALAARGGGR